MRRDRFKCTRNVTYVGQLLKPLSNHNKIHQPRKPPNVSAWSGVGVSGFELATRTESRKMLPSDQRLKQVLLGPFSRSRGVPTEVSRRRHTPSTLHRVD